MHVWNESLLRYERLQFLSSYLALNVGMGLQHMSSMRIVCPEKLAKPMTTLMSKLRKQLDLVVILTD